MLRSCQDNGNSKLDHALVSKLEITSGLLDTFFLDALKSTICLSASSQRSSQTGMAQDVTLTSLLRSWERDHKDWNILKIWWLDSPQDTNYILNFTVKETTRDSQESTKPQAWLNSHMELVTELLLSEFHQPLMLPMERDTLRTEGHHQTSTHTLSPPSY